MHDLRDQEEKTNCKYTNKKGESNKQGEGKKKQKSDLFRIFMDFVKSILLVFMYEGTFLPYNAVGKQGERGEAKLSTRQIRLETR